jgi:lipoprotein NlpI
MWVKARLLLSVFVFAAMVLAGATAAAQQFDYGVQGTDWDDQISVVTTAIQAGQVEEKYLSRALFFRGTAYSNKGQYDLAIEDFDQAIRRNPRDEYAFNNRGNVYYRKGQYDRAIQDYDQAIKIDYDSGAFCNRANAYRAKGQYNLAIADYDQAIRFNPQYATAYFSRGRLKLYTGALPDAVADFSKVRELQDKDAYSALWLDIASRRSHLPGSLSQTGRIDMTAWPAPVISMFLGRLAPAAVLAAADNPDPAIKRGHVCEANFYGGEYALRMAATVEATRLFRLAASDCPHDFVEWEGANAELKALGATP